MKTSDVYLAAALLALGYTLDKIDRKDPRHMVFSFEPRTSSDLGVLHNEVAKENLENVERMWANRTLTVNAFDFAEAIKRMKSIIHSS